MWTSIILIESSLASFLLLSKNNRVFSFHSIRGSKHCFLTSFSYLNQYFLILVFFCNCYLQLSLRLCWLHRNPFSCPFFLIPLGLQCTTLYVRPQVSGTHQAFSQSKMLVTGFLSQLCLSPKVSLANVCWAIVYHTLSSHPISLSWHYFAWHKPPLSQCVQLGQGILKGFSNLWIKVDCCLSYDSF